MQLLEVSGAVRHMYIYVVRQLRVKFQLVWQEIVALYSSEYPFSARLCCLVISSVGIGYKILCVCCYNLVTNAHCIACIYNKLVQSFNNPNFHSQIHFKCLGNKEIYCIFKPCCIVCVLFSAKCHLFHNFILSFPDNTLVFHKPCAKI